MPKGKKMERINRILQCDLFLEHMEKNNTAEAERRFCRHGIEHLLDVARIGWIMNLEEQYGIEKELIYTAALLHDIGKHMQYEEGIPHEVASGKIAQKILKKCGYDDEETRVIVSAILSHREAQIAGSRDLNGLLYRADKASRACFTCPVEDQCNWKADKKNLRIQY